MARYRSLASALTALDERVRENLFIVVSSNIEDQRRQYTQAVQNWHDKPLYTRKLLATKDLITGQVMMGGSEDAQKHWIWTDQGTKPHKIRAKNVPTLKFQTGFAPKTRAVAQSNVGSGRSFGAWRSPIEVDHPGTKARRFTKTWTVKRRLIFRQNVIVALKRASR